MTSSKSESAHLDNEARITLGLLNAVQDNAQVSQRHLSRELGIALGLANAYLKRCVTRGLIKVRQVPANRYAYYLTPRGLSEKSRLAGEFLTQGFQLFRIARVQYAELFEACVRRGQPRVALHGLTDLTEIAVLCSREVDGIRIVGIADPSTQRDDYQGIPVFSDIGRLDPHDVMVIADVGDPQREYDALAKLLPAERLIAPPFLGVDVTGNEDIEP